MSESVGNTTLKQLTLFAEECLASLQVLPGSKEAQRMTVGSGRKLLESLGSFAPRGACLKTLLACCLLSKEVFSTRCYLTWKIWDTKFSRLLYRLAPSMPRTVGSECLFWPTPTGRDWRSPGLQKSYARRRETHQQALNEEVAWGEGSARTGGQLNPTWVEWLQGFPIGWTELDVSETP